MSEILSRIPNEVSTSAELENEVDKLLKYVFSMKESENTWQLLNIALGKLKKWTVKDAYKLDNYLKCMKQLESPINRCLLSDRSKLSSSACELLQEMSKVLGGSFDQIASDKFVPQLLKLSSRANNLFVQRAKLTLEIMIRNSGLYASIPLFTQHIKHPSKKCRLAVASSLATCIETGSTDMLGVYSGQIESAIKSGLCDADGPVRELCRKSFHLYQERFSEKCAEFEGSLPASAIRQLALKAPYCSNDSLTPKIEHQKLSKPKQRVIQGPFRTGFVPQTPKPSYSACSASVMKATQSEKLMHKKSYPIEPPKSVVSGKGLGEPVRMRLNEQKIEKNSAQSRKLGHPTKPKAPLSAKPETKNLLEELPKRVTSLPPDYFKKHSAANKPSRKFISMRSNASCEISDSEFTSASYPDISNTMEAQKNAFTPKLLNENSTDRKNSFE